MTNATPSEVNLNYSLILIGQFILISRRRDFTRSRLSAPGLTCEAKNLTVTEIHLACQPGLAGEVFFIMQTGPKFC